MSAPASDVPTNHGMLPPVALSTESMMTDRIVLLTLVGGALCAFAALLRVAIQTVSGSACYLAQLAVGAAILHGIIYLALHLTSPRQVYTRAILAHISGTLFAGSMFGGLASIWY